MIDEIQKRLLKEVADLDSLPIGAYNIRANGAPAGRNTTAHINIVTKADKPRGGQPDRSQGPGLQ